VSTGLDLSYLRQWIGRTEIVQDSVTPRLMRDYAAMMDQEKPQEIAPLAIHWCLSTPAANASALGPDGHTARDGFLPPVALPRRMWAGGSLHLVDRLRLGDDVQRRSQITGVTIKHGRTGTLCFVTVAHEMSSPRGLATKEEQTIVYREAAAQVNSAVLARLIKPDWVEQKSTDPVLLFRYSALTFNGHRIHYDRPYATAMENYPGLIVHGPLQATWLLEFAARIKKAVPAQFNFCSLQPLFDFELFRLCAVTQEPGLKLWIETGDGRLTMEATAQW
jgi:3-methylfumaryl-CoA hydratase